MGNNSENLNEFELAMNLQEKGDYKKSLEILELLAEKNYPPAIGNIGCFYQLGLGVEINGKKAVEYLKRAVELGFGPAAHNLGTIYGGGMPGIEKDSQLSDFYRHKANELGVNYIKK